MARSGRPGEDGLVRPPPATYFVASAVLHYLGPSLAVLLFAHVATLGVAWLRIAAAALVFALWRRPWHPAPAADPRAGRRAGRDELRVLSGHRPAATVHSGRDRVPRPGGAGRARRAEPSQPPGAAARRGRRARPHRRPARRRAARLRVRVRQLRGLRAVCPIRTPRRHQRHRHRPARRVDARRRGPRHAVRQRRRRARVHPPGLAAVGHRGGRVVVGAALRLRSAGDGPAPPRHLRPHAVTAAGHRDDRRPRRPRTGPGARRGRRHRPRHRGRGHPQGGCSFTRGTG